MMKENTPNQGRTGSKNEILRHNRNNEIPLLLIILFLIEDVKKYRVTVTNKQSSNWAAGLARERSTRMRTREIE